MLLFAGIPGGDASVCCYGVHGRWTAHGRPHGDRDEGALDCHGLQGGCPGHQLPPLQEYSPQRHQGERHDTMFVLSNSATWIHCSRTMCCWALMEK